MRVCSESSCSIPRVPKFCILARLPISAHFDMVSSKRTHQPQCSLEGKVPAKEQCPGSQEHRIYPKPALLGSSEAKAALPQAALGDWDLRSAQGWGLEH